MFYLYRLILTFHIVAVISWMAGILYLIRLFVYHAEETLDVVKERFSVMERRLSQVIMLPAMLVSLVLGMVLIWLNPALLTQSWMQLKLLLVLALMGMTHQAGSWRRELLLGKSQHSAKFFRIMNEIPTLLMFLIVLMVIVRPPFRT